MNIYDTKIECSGCGACAARCPKGAIRMKRDSEGFKYPELDENSCVNCKLCLAVCPQKDNSLFHDEPKFYVAKNIDINIIKQSASGGAFTALSNKILRQGGSVYGVIFTKEFEAVHSRANNVQLRDEMCKSKYVQSDIGSTYHDIKHDLTLGKTVLFTGTPCQVAGLRKYLGKEYDNLILCDIVCHSVSSPLIWKEYLNVLEKEIGSKLTYVNCRDKTEGWQRASTLKGFGFSGEDKEVHFDNRFYKLFFREKLIARPSCSKCKYAQVKRVSDITIADYWGVEKYIPEWKEFYGVSFIMTSTVKGETLLQNSHDELIFEQRPKEEEINENHRLRGPMGISNVERQNFWNDYYEQGIEYVLKKYAV